MNLILFWSIGFWFDKVATNLLTYGNYSASFQRINKFLELPQKKDDLGKMILTEKIRSINFKNVSFKYNSSSDWVLQNYSEVFETKKINRLSGENGRGKSTIIYLILGLVEPNKGEIIITDAKNQVYNLHRDINLKYWREEKVAYFSHDNLIEEDVSTGQKQLINIKNILISKKNTTIFISDEADNALDSGKQKEFYNKLEGLSKEKLIIYVNHEPKENQSK